MNEKRLRKLAGLNEDVSHAEADKRAKKLTKELLAEVAKIIKKKQFKDLKITRIPGEDVLAFFDDEVDYMLNLGISAGVGTLGISRLRKSPRKGDDLKAIGRLADADRRG